MTCFSVSPGSDAPDRFETVQQAMQAVRELPRPWTGDVVVDLEPAVYRLTEPIEIGPEDGGRRDGPAVSDVRLARITATTCPGGAMRGGGVDVVVS